MADPEADQTKLILLDSLLQESFESWQTQRQIRSRHSETSWLITTNSVKLVLQIAFGISLQGKLGALRASVL